MTGNESVLAGQAVIKDWQEEFYTSVHAHPELGHQEVKTAAAVAAGLRDAGYDVQEKIGSTGVVGVLKNGDGPVVLMRADMDALPIEEATGLPYASTVHATDGDGNDVPVMHACGHDVHVACLLGADVMLKARTAIVDAIHRIVTAECEASGSPQPPSFDLYDHYPVTDNQADATATVSHAFTRHFGAKAFTIDRQSASEDFSEIPDALGVPYTYWGLGGIDPETYARAEAAGTVATDIPANHSPDFAPVIEPTLETGTAAAVVAALAWLGGGR